MLSIRVNGQNGEYFTPISSHQPHLSFDTRPGKLKSIKIMFYIVDIKYNFGLRGNYMNSSIEEIAELQES